MKTTININKLEKLERAFNARLRSTSLTIYWHLTYDVEELTRELQKEASGE